MASLILTADVEAGHSCHTSSMWSAVCGIPFCFGSLQRCGAPSCIHCDAVAVMPFTAEVEAGKEELARVDGLRLELGARLELLKVHFGSTCDCERRGAS
jgi:hypothetical protein